MKGKFSDIPTLMTKLKDDLYFKTIQSLLPLRND